MKNSKILFVHEVNYQTKVIFEMHEFPELLASRGHRVSFFHYPESAAKAKLASTQHIIRGRVHPEVTLNLITPPSFGGAPWERFIAPILAWHSLRKVIRRGKFDIIVLLAVPTTGWQTVMFANREGTATIFRALDVSHRIRGTIVSKLVLWAEKFIYPRVTVLSANTPAMRQYCKEVSGRTGPSVVNLPPVDLSHFANQEGSIHRRSLGLTDADQILLYMGTFFRFSGLATVIRNFADAHKINSLLRLVLVGGGEIEDELKQLTHDLNLNDSVIFTGVIPYAQLPAYLKIADVAINPFEVELLTNVALPHKVLQYMAAGIPTVSTDLEGIHGVLGENSGVTWVASPDLVVSAALDLLNRDRAALSSISKKQFMTVRELFDVSKVVDEFEATIELAIMTHAGS